MVNPSGCTLDKTPRKCNTNSRSERVDLGRVGECTTSDKDVRLMTVVVDGVANVVVDESGTDALLE
jgi:hypothetical protein